MFLTLSLWWLGGDVSSHLGHHPLRGCGLLEEVSLESGFETGKVCIIVEFALSLCLLLEVWRCELSAVSAWMTAACCPDSLP